jgi:hypothetical protein
MIKVTDTEDGVVLINGEIHPKGSFWVDPRGNGIIQLGKRSDPIKIGHFSEYLDESDTPFTTEEAAMDYLDICFIPES